MARKVVSSDGEDETITTKQSRNLPLRHHTSATTSVSPKKPGSALPSRIGSKSSHYSSKSSFSGDDGIHSDLSRGQACQTHTTTERRVRVLPVVNSLATRDMHGAAWLQSISATPKTKGNQIQVTTRATPARRAKTNSSYRLPLTPDIVSSDTSDTEESVWHETRSVISESDIDSESDGSVRWLSTNKIVQKERRTQGHNDRDAFKWPSDLDVSVKHKSISVTSAPDARSGSPRGVAPHHSPRWGRRLSAEELKLKPTVVLAPSPTKANPPPRPTTPTERTRTPPPSSPSKSRLQSPSKKRFKVPTPPGRGRPSLDNFWDAQQINTWNDQYSPKKPLLSPSKNRFFPLDAGPECPPSPSKSRSPTNSPKKSKAEIAARKDFDASKEETARSFLDELDEKICQGQISRATESTGGVKLVWSKTLNSTAGRASWKRESVKTASPDGKKVYKHHATIELASKVITDPLRLRNTLAHEFCHLTTYIISGVKDNPHGAEFKKWGRIASKLFGEEGVEVTTKHSYEVEWKYLWLCAGRSQSKTDGLDGVVDGVVVAGGEMRYDGGCGREYGRHSKSIDPGKVRCGACKGHLVQVRPAPRGVKGKTAGAETKGFAVFVKENFAVVKKGLEGESHGKVMEELGRRWREAKKEGMVGGIEDVLGKDVDDGVLTLVKELEVVVLDD